MAEYQVLARKWRPHRFQEMVGQEHILRMLSNALEQQRIHHAYLFTGTRGVGKTTIARLLAKCLNCEVQISATPCDNCGTCKAIDQGRFLDLYEVDAASRTKVEDTRELLENVLYPPSQGRFKIYLIDEVHMLSNHSFNALLKTLEEPPTHVKFLFATTDPKRLPITILSRCLQFHLKRIPADMIAKHLEHIATQENIAFEPAALKRLSIAADGSMRDALSLLDQAIAYSKQAINTNDVNQMLGSRSQEDLLPLLQALAAKDGKACFDYTQQLAESAPDYAQVLAELISIFHKLALAKVVPDTLVEDEALQAYSNQFSPEELQLYYQIALLSRRDLALAPIPQQGFEMALLRILTLKPAGSRIEPPSEVIPLKQTTTPSAATQIGQENGGEWRDILGKLKLTGMAYALASNCSLGTMEEGRVELLLSPAHKPMLNPKLTDRLREALSNYLNRPIHLDIKMSDTCIHTPLKQEQLEQQQRIATATQSIMDDPQVKQLVEMYDATVEVSLL